MFCLGFRLDVNRAFFVSKMLQKVTMQFITFDNSMLSIKNSENEK